MTITDSRIRKIAEMIKGSTYTSIINSTQIPRAVAMAIAMQAADAAGQALERAAKEYGIEVTA